MTQPLIALSERAREAAPAPADAHRGLTTDRHGVAAESRKDGPVRAPGLLKAHDLWWSGTIHTNAGYVPRSRHYPGARSTPETAASRADLTRRIDQRWLEADDVAAPYRAPRPGADHEETPPASRCPTPPASRWPPLRPTVAPPSGNLRGVPLRPAVADQKIKEGKRVQVPAGCRRRSSGGRIRGNARRGGDPMNTPVPFGGRTAAGAPGEDLRATDPSHAAARLGMLSGLRPSKASCSPPVYISTASASTRAKRRDRP